MGGAADANGTQIPIKLFQDNEAITDPITGAAVANGVNSLLFSAFTGVAIPPTSNMSGRSKTACSLSRKTAYRHGSCLSIA
jgi:hypothetical protein